MKNRSVAFIDKQVILTMIACIIIAITVFAFRYKNYEPYTPVEISVRDGKIITGEMVRLTAETKQYSSEELAWDFGDKSMQKGNGTMVTHIYSTPGKYEVTLHIKGKNRESKTVYVAEVPAPPKPDSPIFTCPSTAIVGEAVVFKDFTPHAISWEWSFGETNKVDATSRQTSYTFKSPGKKRIILVINGKVQGDTTVLVSEKVRPGITIIKKAKPVIAEIPTGPTLKEQQTAKPLKSRP